MMEQDDLKKYLRKIGDLVLDEEKIVTYKLLSRTLDIHVNTAKQLLHTFLSQQQECSPGNVSATYLLAGLLKDGSSLVSIVKGDNLNEAYLKFDIITSEHVYSVQKGKATSIERNSEILYIADSKLRQHKSWVIKCDDTFEGDTFERSSNTLAETVEEFGSNASVKTEGEKTEEKSERKYEEREAKVNGVAHNPPPPPTPSRTARVRNENGVVKLSPRKDKKRNLISHFFNNHSQRKKLNAEECEAEKPKDCEGAVGKGEISKNIDDIDLEQISLNEKSSGEKDVGKEKPVTKSKSSAKRKSRGGDTKKRKRIISDPEDSESDEEREDAMLCPEPEVPQDVEALIRSDDDDDDDDDGDIFRHKKKRKKFVDKTVLREDGYMETIKEIVYETDSENESKVKKEIKAVKNEAPKPSKPQETFRKKALASKNTSKKQQTLLSFFKRN